MIPELLGVVYLLLPLLGGAVVHGICMRYGWLGFLTRPMDLGYTWRGRPIFGRSKTFRGPVLVAVGSGAVYALQREALWAWVVAVTPFRLSASLVVAAAIHPLLTLAGYLLGMRPTAR